MGALVQRTLEGCVVIDRMFKINLLQHALQEASVALNSPALPVGVWHCGRAPDVEALQERRKF